MSIPCEFMVFCCPVCEQPLTYGGLMTGPARRVETLTFTAGTGRETFAHFERIECCTECYEEVAPLVEAAAEALLGWLKRRRGVNRVDLAGLVEPVLRREP